MALSSTTLLSSLGFLLLCHASLAQLETGEGRSPWEGSRRLGSQSECRIERLNAQEPRRTVESEAGRSEFFDESNEQFDCAGVSAVRRTIQPGGLQLPSFSNAPTLVYIIQG